MPTIDAIIFDLGGVVLDLDFNRTKIAFEKLGVEDFDAFYSKNKQAEIFKDFETGNIEAEDLYYEMLDVADIDVDQEEFWEAWNEMLLPFDNERMTFFENLQHEVPTYVLSNTNEVHIERVQELLLEATGKDNIRKFFTDVFFSSALGLRKPNPEIFDWACEKYSLIPRNTVFIDDTEMHVKAAKQLGMRAFLFDGKVPIQDFVRNILNQG